MWTLIKYLPAILSKLLPLNCPLRKFAGIMNDLLRMCLKTSLTEADLYELDITITTFNKEFLRLFNTQENSRPLTPKAHNLLHYVRIIKNAGPLKFLWSMRFESKHQESKAYAKMCHSRRNLCYSLNKNICYNNAYNILEDANLLKKVTDYKVIGENMKMCPNHNHCETRSCTNAKYQGNMYSVGCYILSSCLKFASKILEIGINEEADQLILITGIYNVSFNKSLRMYKLDENNHITNCKMASEFTHPPIISHKFDGVYYLQHDEF